MLNNKKIVSKFEYGIVQEFDYGLALNVSSEISLGRTC